MGYGSLAASLAPALRDAGYEITEIVMASRAGGESVRRARTLAKEVGARAVTAGDSALDASVLWLCVPDRGIRETAAAIAARLATLTRQRGLTRLRFAFHSSGALLSDELVALRKDRKSVV